jgi:hypothetical protein
MMLLHTKNTGSPFLQRKKSQILDKDAAAHQKQLESLPPKKMAQLLDSDAAAHQTQCHQHLAEEEKRIAIQIKSFATTLYEKIDLDLPIIIFLWDNFYKDPTLALAYYHCCSINPCAVIFNDKLGLDGDASAMWDCISNSIDDLIGQEETVLCQRTLTNLDQSHAKVAACESC